MRLLLAGDKGARPGDTAEDRMWEEAAEYDWYARSYQWTPGDVDDCPRWLLDRLPAIGAMRAEIEDRRQRTAAAAERAKRGRR